MVKRLRNFVARVTQNVVYYCPPILFAMMHIMHCTFCVQIIYNIYLLFSPYCACGTLPRGGCELKIVR